MEKEKFCENCGQLLLKKECAGEGVIPFCHHCNEYRFPHFSVAISAIILNPDQNSVLLVQQYGSQDNILVAGYVSQGENLETTVIREIEEETGLLVHCPRYMSSEYYSKSNTLVCNYLCIAESEDLSGTNHEIDSAAWFTFEAALLEIKPNSLAETFLKRAIQSLN